MKTARRFLMYGIPKSFLFKIILLLLILLIGKNVFAAEFNMNSFTSAVKNGTKNRYRATEIYNTGMSNTYTFGTKYNGRISDIETYFDYPFTANMTYRLTYNMNTDDFRNHFGSSYWWYCDQEMTNINAHVSTVNYVSYRKVTFTFTPTETSTCIRVWLRSSNLSSTAITGVSNWQLNNITIYDPEWQNGSSSSSGSQGTSPGSSGTSSTNSNEEIINNATENTHTIVDNQNQNTQDIINNNNDNTQDIIDNQNENNHGILNSLESLNQQLGLCYKNIFKNIYSINAFRNMYLGTNDTFYQYEPDDYSTPRNLKLQFLSYDGSLISESDYRPYLSVGRFNFTFTYTDDISYLATGINGSVRDSIVKIPLDGLDLQNDTVYTLSYSIPNATNGSVEFKYFSLVKGAYSSNFVIDYDKAICTSKLDDINGSISNFITDAAENAQNIINNQNQNAQQTQDSIRDNLNSCEPKKPKYVNFINRVYIYRNSNDVMIMNFSYQNNASTYIYEMPDDLQYKIKVLSGTNLRFGFSDTLYNFSTYDNGFLDYGFQSSSSNFQLNTFYSFNTSKRYLYVFSNNILTIDDIVFEPNGCIYTNKLDTLNDSINNDNVDSGTGSDFFSNFNSTDNGGISGIITKPLTLINSLLSNNDSCSDLTFGIQFPGLQSQNVSFPSGCVLWNRVPNNVVSLYQIFVVGFSSYYLLKRLFKDVEDLKNPEKDSVEVIDL